MSRINIADFVPPIYYRVISYVRRRYISMNGGSVITRPFDAVPRDIDAKWILDVGANVGDVSDAALRSFPRASVICFEPVKKTFAELSERMRPFGGRAYLYNCALSDEEEEGEINITTSNGANSILPQPLLHQESNPHVREIEKETIQLVRLDDFATNFPSQKIDIMKIDVEGYELNVLKGGAHFIAENVDIIIIEISLMRDHSKKDQAVFKIFSFLDELGFFLVNVMDIHHAHDDVQLLQMDCVFRNKKSLGLGK